MPDELLLTIKIKSAFFSPDEVIEMVTDKLGKFSSVEKEVINIEIVSKVVNGVNVN
jgi:hypothetical protein